MPTVNDPNGEPVLVTSEGMMRVYAVTETEALHANEDEQSAFSVLVDVTSATTDDDFFYLKNNDDRTIVIYKIKGWCDDASQEIKILLGATDAGTDAGDALTPVALTAGSGSVADVDCTQDATDLAITGGSAADVLKFAPVALTESTWTYASGLLVPKNQRLHMEAALAGLINLNIFFYFHD